MRGPAFGDVDVAPDDPMSPKDSSERSLIRRALSREAVGFRGVVRLV
jgi:hypothetical protein